MLKRINVLAVLCVGLGASVSAQNVNSPYSRYGLGDILSGQNIQTRSMGGIGTAYSHPFSVNFLNPASYGMMPRVTLDFAVELNNLTIRAQNPARRFSNASPVISYFNLGIPLKIKKKPLGLVVGLRPMSRINYKIERRERLTGGGLNDSISTLFEGNGGAQQVFAGTGYSIGRFSFGVNVGYLFGTKDYSTRRGFLNDTVLYYKSNHATNTNFNGFFLNAGAQYIAKIDDKSALHFGVQGNWQQNVKGKQDIIRETFEYDANSAEFRIDSVFEQKDRKGDVVMPASYSAGIIYEKFDRFMIGVDYVTTKWSNYQFFNEKDPLQDSWEMRLGGQFTPTRGKNYWSNVTYRTGFSYGKDYVNVTGELPKWTYSIGAALPLRQVYGTNQFTIINTSFEFGNRGTNSNGVRESFFKVAVGLCMSDVWFIKNKYR